MSSPNASQTLSDPIEALFEQLKSSSKGLSEPEADARRATFGSNETHHQNGHHLKQALWSLVGNPLVIILVVAAGLSMWLGDVVDGAVIIAIVVLSATINLVQTRRSHDAVSALQRSMAPTATVLRDGAWKEVLRKDLVPGDMIRLTAGDLVPADARLVESNDLHVQQAALTGESLPVAKAVEAGAVESSEPSEADACVFLGTSVVSGVATALVVRTGSATEFGDIAQRLALRAPETEFERGLKGFGLLILKTVVFLVFFVFLSSIALKRDALESLMFSVALAVGLTPEFLPMITTVTLSRGAVFMARKGVIVKNLSAIQNLGNMDILCSDKTGTLTSGKMSLEKVVGPDGEDRPELLRIAAINSKLESGVDSSLDDAILLKAGDPVGNIEKLGEAPFDFERRRMSIAAVVDGNPLLICKGAAESVLEASVSVRSAGGLTDLNDSERGKCSSVLQELGGNGYRVLGVATRTVDSKDRYSADDEQGLILEGFLAFIDPALPDAAEMLESLRKVGVTVKIISGDDQLVTRHVCAQVGMATDRIVLGREIDSMTDPALQAVAEQCSIFARVSPAQKSRIILALKARGHVVGYMGDGINDAPSLHAADVGISAAGAVDVAKDAASFILVRPGLDVLREGVLQGRVAFGNVLKYLLMGTSSNFGNMFSMAGATLFLPFLPMLPTQILLNNFLYDLSQITIPTDSVDDEMIRRPHRWDIGLIRNFMVVIGPISSIFDFLTFWVLLHFFKASEREFHTGWFVESLATQVLVILVIRTMGVPWKSKPSKPLAWTVLLVVATAVLIPFTLVGTNLGFVALPVSYFGFLLVATAGYLLMVEAVKRKIFSAHWGRADS